jgi:hypothetical protein
MRITFVAAVLLVMGSALAAADLPVIPADPIAVKKEQLFTDDFERTELGPAWGPVVPTYAIENGALKGTQTRFNAPAADGKPAVVGHAAVIGTTIPTKDSVLAFRLRFAGATALSAEFDDRAYTGSHYGHICRVVVTLADVTLRDECEGSMRNDIYEMGKDPSKKAERLRLIAGRSATFPHELAVGTWYSLVLETAGDAMRASIDGTPVAYLKSSGIAHPTKSKIEFGCAGADGFFDDITIWNADPAK